MKPIIIAANFFRMTAIIIQLLIGGVLLGGLYALIAFGLSLIYGVARVLNFAHGTLLAIAGIAASIMFAAWNISPALIAVILFPIFFAFGWLMYVTLLEPLKHRNPMQMTVGTVLQIISWHEAHHHGQAHITLNLYRAAHP